MKAIVAIDVETSRDGKILDMGAAFDHHDVLHTKEIASFYRYITKAEYVCGHNIVKHDFRILRPRFERLERSGKVGTETALEKTKPNDKSSWNSRLIDTLLLSALLFPKHPHHHLLKDDKILSDELNNPVNDALKAMQLLEDEIWAYRALPHYQQQIFQALLSGQPGFEGFFRYLASGASGDEAGSRGEACNAESLVGLEDACSSESLVELIKIHYAGRICESAELDQHVKDRPIELAYCLSQIDCDDALSVAPRWVNHNYPHTASIMKALRNVPCIAGCSYCYNQLDARKALRRFFGFDDFRLYDGEPLQLEAVNAAINGNSLLAIFPTAGGKSLAFQLPALLAGRNAKTLTVVISPLVSLMKDQVDNLEDKSINSAVTINSLLDSVERKNVFERVESGEACILYIAPESLRQPGIARLLQKRNIERFVIDEAHCFSAWGQDFRTDYQHIAPFISQLQKGIGRATNREVNRTIPISCFTATAKQNVIDDIRSYFKRELKCELKLIRSYESRKNLHYRVHYCTDDAQKYHTMRLLLSGDTPIPTIVYVSRTKKTEELAERLTQDGYPALCYHGRMDRADKSAHQDLFISGQVNIMVATSAFGMGVDKKDVGRIIHFDVSDSLESYVQEAGRAGRDERIQADCHVLYNDEDLNKHFILLNQSKIQIKEIQQAWKAIKRATQFRQTIATSAKELARDAGWDDTLTEISTRVTTSIAALENAGYVRREQNSPVVYASSISVRSMMEARQRIEESPNLQAFEPDAGRVIQYLISRRSSIDVEDAQIDVMSDSLGIEKRRLIDVVTVLKQEGLLADDNDLLFYLDGDQKLSTGKRICREFLQLEQFILNEINKGSGTFNLKELNKSAGEAHIANSSVRRLRTIFNYWEISGLVKLEVSGYNRSCLRLSLETDLSHFRLQIAKRRIACEAILEHLERRSATSKSKEIATSIIELTSACNSNLQTVATLEPDAGAGAGAGAGVNTHAVTYAGTNADTNAGTNADNQAIMEIGIADAESSLLFLNRINALKVDGGFLVLYNQLRITRLEENPRKKYTAEDYAQLDDYYKQRIQMIHIVGEYVKKVAEDYENALAFVDDYFRMEYSQFLRKHFRGKDRLGEIKISMTPEKFRRIFGELSPQQLKIIREKDAKRIVVAAGPGSGKTRVLVHKLAALLLMEDIKHEQLLVLTFSRSAATEFKGRLFDLVGNAASFVEVKTFHSYAFDIVGRPGSIDESESIVRKAAEAIAGGDVESNRIAKSVVVIDEAQDMDAHEFMLIKALMAKNEGLRIIAVGDDDQNIFEFRGSDSKYFESLALEPEAASFDLIDNYRSKANLVALHNDFLTTMKKRMKKEQIEPHCKDSGSIRLIKHTGTGILGAVLEEVAQNGTPVIARNEVTKQSSQRDTTQRLDCHAPQAVLAMTGGYANGNLEVGPGAGPGVVLGAVPEVGPEVGPEVVPEVVPGVGPGAGLEGAAQLHLRGSTCITVFLNEDASCLRTALRKKGLNARLIQGGDLQSVELEGGRIKWVSSGFDLGDLRELHCFFSCLQLEQGETWIDEEDWKEARRQLRVLCSGSTDLPLVTELLNSFERANRNRKYLSDLQAFIAESSLEDFIDTERAGLYISTMHKTKGREFDNVIMVLQGYSTLEEERKRLLYVTMSRAKENLCVHFDKMPYFENLGLSLGLAGSSSAISGWGFSEAKSDLSSKQQRAGRAGRTRQAIPSMTYALDEKDYPSINEHTLDLSHRDVWLSKFIDNQTVISRLKAGDDLYLYQDSRGCKDKAGRHVVSFSKAFYEALREMLKQGYQVVQCRINHILYWNDEEHPEERFLIVLPQLELTKSPEM